MNDSETGFILDRQAFERATLLQRGRTIVMADAYVLNHDGKAYLVKTFRRTPAPLRQMWGLPLLRHEHRVLEALAGLEGIPAVYGIHGGCSLVMEYVAGSRPLGSLGEFADGELPSPEFFVRFRDLVNALHERGVSHGDIRRRNVLRAPGEMPYLIDFATGVVLGEKPGWIRRLAFRQFRRADRFGVAKMIRGFHPEVCTDEERAMLEEQPPSLKAGRWFRRHIYRKFVKPRAWKRRVEKARQKLQGKEQEAP